MMAKSGKGDRGDRQPQRPSPGKNRMPSDSRTLDLFRDDSLPQGLKYQPDFLSCEEEHSLLQHVRFLPFREFEFHGFTGKRRTVSFGWRYDFNGGGLTRRICRIFFSAFAPVRKASWPSRPERFTSFSSPNIPLALLSVGTRIA